MNKKYKNLNALEDEDVRAITGGTKIRKPKKMFNMLHHYRKHKKRLYFNSSKWSLDDTPATLDLSQKDYCKYEDEE